MSYVNGVSPVPLLGETIGANLERTAARYWAGRAWAQSEQLDS